MQKFNFTNLIQGSDEWLEYRKGGLGSSDAPIIMGCSPWMTAEELFKEKIGKKKPKKMTEAMERGHRLEPAARAYYEFKSEIDFIPITVEHPQYPFLRASLDGYNEEFKIILEIKAPGRETHLKALRGEVPEHYRIQCLHQLMVTGANRCDYFSFDGSRGVVVHVYPNAFDILTLREQELHFWECVQNKKWAPFEVSK